MIMCLICNRFLLQENTPTGSHDPPSGHFLPLDWKTKWVTQNKNKLILYALANFLDFVFYLRSIKKLVMFDSPIPTTPTVSTRQCLFTLQIRLAVQRVTVLTCHPSRPRWRHTFQCVTQQSSAFPRLSGLNYTDAGATQHPLQSQAISDPILSHCCLSTSQFFSL